MVVTLIIPTDSLGTSSISILQGGGFCPGGRSNNQKRSTVWSSVLGALSSLGLALEQDELPPGTEDLRLVTLVYQGWEWEDLGLKRGHGPQATQGVGSC